MDKPDNSTIPDRGPLKRSRLKKDDTAQLPLRRRRQPKQDDSPGTASFGPKREVLLMIRGMIERVVLTENRVIVIGRSDINARFHPDVDLTNYGAIDRGVSRTHASLHMENDHLYITDKGSTNGTFINGEQLEPEVAYMLRKGEEILLGRLPVQVLF